MQVTTQSSLTEFPLLSRRKVRDIYEISADTLLIITTDRMSAFDVVLEDAIPYKGVLLNQLSLFWMDLFSPIVGNHFITSDVAKFPAELHQHAAMLEGRSALVRRTKPVMLECVVRGYLCGQAWKEYCKTGCVGEHSLPKGLEKDAPLPEPIFTPSTKTAMGEHDRSLTEDEAVKIAGFDTFTRIREYSLAMYKEAVQHADKADIILADTKFEFGLIGKEVVLIDEVLTPDSSRFWDKSLYMPGHTQASFDKQYLRDWLESQGWDKAPPPPALPKVIIERTAQKYFEAYERLTGKSLRIFGA